MIIGFSGSFGSGKTTRAQYLSEKLNQMGKDYYFINFAGNLKTMLYQHLKVSSKYFNTTEGKSEICPKYGVTYGSLLQKYGQGMRDIDPNYWIDELQNEIKDVGNTNCIIVIGDVRYQNEMDWILKKGGIVFKKLGLVGSVRCV